MSGFVILKYTIHHIDPTKILKKRISIVLVILAIIIGFILEIFGPEIVDSPTSSVSLTKINESGIPKGKIVHLIENDF
jgi:hypothetical protein